MGICVADASQRGDEYAGQGTRELGDWERPGRTGQGTWPNAVPERPPEKQTGLTPSDMSKTAKGPQEAASHLSPAVVKLRVADGKRLRRERHRDRHGNVVGRVQRLLVVNDVGVLELDLLHLGVLVRLLVDDLTVDRLELVVEHSLDGRRVLRRLDRHRHVTTRNARGGLALGVRVAFELVVGIQNVVLLTSHFQCGSE